MVQCKILIQLFHFKNSVSRNSYQVWLVKSTEFASHPLSIQNFFQCLHRDKRSSWITFWQMFFFYASILALVEKGNIGQKLYNQYPQKCKYEIVLKFLTLKPKKTLFFVVRLSHYCRFKVEHAFPNQSFFRPSFDHYHELPSAFYAVLTLLILFQFQSLSVDVLMQLLKKKIKLRECPYIFSSDVS